jgi:hypothetical protein
MKQLRTAKCCRQLITNHIQDGRGMVVQFLVTKKKIVT